jgi:transcriptional regulator with XRE-family HTH domain
LSLIRVSKLLKICPDTVRAWEENRKSPRLRTSKRIIDFLGYFPPIATNRFPIRKRLYFARLIRGETQREAAKIIGVGASKFINIELGKWRVTGEIREKIHYYVSEAFSSLSNRSMF